MMKVCLRKLVLASGADGKFTMPGQPFPTLSTEYFAQGIAILNFLRTLPDVGLAHAEKAELLYAEVRSNVLSQSLEDSQQDALLIISLGADGETKGLGRLVDVTVSLLKVKLNPL